MAMPLPKCGEMEHCTGFLGRWNYPQRSGTRPENGQARSCPQLYCSNVHYTSKKLTRACGGNIRDASPCSAAAAKSAFGIPIHVGAQLIRNDTICNAALVSFGSFGIIYGIVIETEPLYLLEEERHRLSLTVALRHAMRTLDFSGIPTPYPGQTPFHFEVVVNPHNPTGGAYVTTMYQRPYHTGYTPPEVSSSGLG